MSSIFPYRLEYWPAPRHASHPPTVDRSMDWGQWPRVTPWPFRRPDSTSGPKVPARRSATSDPVSTSPRPARPQRSRATPPNSGTDAPHTPLRPPAGVTGTRAWSQRARTAATCPVSVGLATTAGRAGTCPATAHPMASGHQSRPDSARSSSAEIEAQTPAAARGGHRPPPPRGQPDGRPPGRGGVDRGHRCGSGRPVSRRDRILSPRRAVRLAPVPTLDRVRPGPVHGGTWRRTRRPRSRSLVVPPQLGADQVGDAGGRPGRRPGVRSEARVRRVEHVGHGAGHLLAQRRRGLDREVVQPSTRGSSRSGRPSAKARTLGRLGAEPAGQVGAVAVATSAGAPARRWLRRGGRAPAGAPSAAAAGRVTQRSDRRPRGDTTTSTVSSAILR